MIQHVAASIAHRLLHCNHFLKCLLSWERSSSFLNRCLATNLPHRGSQRRTPGPQLCLPAVGRRCDVGGQFAVAERLLHHLFSLLLEQTAKISEGPCANNDGHADASDVGPPSQVRTRGETSHGPPPRVAPFVEDVSAHRAHRSQQLPDGDFRRECECHGDRSRYSLPG